MRLPDQVRRACAAVAERARLVRIDEAAIAPYAASLPLGGPPPELDAETHYLAGGAEGRAAFVLSIDAVNFGSGWWPTIRKRPGRSGYFTMALSLKERFERDGPWQPEELARIGTAEVAAVFGQDAGHELMALFARALRELGERAAAAGGYLALAERAGSAVALAEELATWPTFFDVSPYGELEVPLWKRAQLAAADLHHAGAVRFDDLDALTLFSDNLVPHVLRLDGLLRYDDELVRRIEAGELLEHDSPEEVEIRAVAVHAVELLAAASGATPQELDYVLWNRGREPRCKARPRHRARTTAY